MPVAGKILGGRKELEGAVLVSATYEYFHNMSEILVKAVL
jgi:hypothetical protein